MRGQRQNRGRRYAGFRIFLAVDENGQPSQPPVGERSDGSWLFPHHRGHIGNRHPGQDSQRDCSGLLIGELLQQRQGPIEIVDLAGCVGDSFVRLHGDGRSTEPSPPSIDQPTVSKGEDPPTERVSVTNEHWKLLRYFEPDLLSQIVGFDGIPASEEAQQGGIPCRPDGPDGPFVTLDGTSKNLIRNGVLLELCHGWGSSPSGQFFSLG